MPSPGLDPRGVDIDSNGVVWTALAASSHLASFDVRKCKNLNGTAEEKLAGTLCPEGWALYQTTGPKFQGTNIPTEFHYFNWTDQYGASGFPPNTPMATGSNSDSILVLTSQQGAGTWVTMRVPFPLGFYARGLDARIDDPKLRRDSQVGKTAQCGPTTEPTLCGTSKAEKAPRARKSNSRFGLILWLVKFAKQKASEGTDFNPYLPRLFFVFSPNCKMFWVESLSRRERVARRAG